VINTSSRFGIIAMHTKGTFNASKFSVRGYTEVLRMELEGAPVSATCIHPSGVATNIVTASRVDESIRTLTGQDVDAHRRQNHHMINVTTPDAAARQILADVERNARRVHVGRDAPRTDKLARLLGSAYQVIVLRFVRKSQEVDARRQRSTRQPG
jgi:short-subunit dehydrogenase